MIVWVAPERFLLGAVDFEKVPFPHKYILYIYFLFCAVVFVFKGPFLSLK